MGDESLRSLRALCTGKTVVSVKWWKSVSTSSFGLADLNYAAFATRAISSQPSIFRSFT